MVNDRIPILRKRGPEQEANLEESSVQASTRKEAKFLSVKHTFAVGRMDYAPVPERFRSAEAFEGRLNEGEIRKRPLCGCSLHAFCILPNSFRAMARNHPEPNAETGARER
ncbi:hypothetical protein ZHAS_00003620 [Anopheles sinensis]|uniref:Uncharacterized protein n=1 Tax=Anopheles sinensis TaxID=74873 RepID=A0A084VEU6_ANOSI|nr:hypothetical protein ZHAS_00003620 [Anopheles sinensis]